MQVGLVSAWAPFGRHLTTWLWHWALGGFRGLGFGGLGLRGLGV